jgi:hypothetical protein
MMRYGKETLHHGLDHFFVGAARSRNGLFDFAWRKFFNRKTGETGRAVTAEGLEAPGQPWLKKRILKNDRTTARQTA